MKKIRKIKKWNPYTGASARKWWLVDEQYQERRILRGVSMLQSIRLYFISRCLQIRGRGWWSTAQQSCSHIWLRFQSFTLKIVLGWLLKSKLRDWLSRTDGRISQARFWDKMRPSLEPLWLHILCICSLVGVWIGFESHKKDGTWRGGSSRADSFI